jgi:hypothetical protein
MAPNDPYFLIARLHVLAIYSGLLGHRRTYLTILESADHALFKMVRYVLLRPLGNGIFSLKDRREETALVGLRLLYKIWVQSRNKLRESPVTYTLEMELIPTPRLFKIWVQSRNNTLVFSLLRFLLTKYLVF